MICFGGGIAASALLFLSATTSVLSAPLAGIDFGLPSDNSLEIFSRQDRVADTITDYNQICGHDVNKESLDDIWWKTTVGLYLDVFLSGKDDRLGYSSWVQKLDKFAWKKQQSDAWDCTSLPGKCGPPADCKEFFYLQDSPQEYWIMKAVTGAHKVMSLLHTALLEDTIQTYFDLDTIISDFSGNVKDLSDLWGKLAAAFTIAAGGASALPGPGGFVGGGLTIVAGIFSLVATEESAQAKAAASGLDVLKAHFATTREHLKQLARDVFGTGNQDNIPKSLQSGNWNNAVARFFEGGKYLIEDVDSAMDATIKNANKLMQQSIGMAVLAAHGWVLLIDPTIKNEGSCTKDGPSRIWKGEYNECWGILKWEVTKSGDLFSSDRIKVTHLNSDSVEKMKKYGVDLPTVYDNAIACKLAHPDGSERKIKAEDLALNGGKLPQCFFNIDVYKGSFSDSEFKAQDLWNQW